MSWIIFDFDSGNLDCLDDLAKGSKGAANPKTWLMKSTVDLISRNEKTVRLILRGTAGKKYANYYSG